jgi:ribosome-associated translation inhibitor RaiA
MNTNIQAQGFDLLPAIEARVLQQTGRALGHFGNAVVHVDAFLKDVNGPKGGIDKQALLRVRLRNRPPVVVEAVHHDLYTAIDLSARRLRRVVKRELGKHARPARARPGMSQGLQTSGA